MKVIVYAICKNEELFVDRWMDSMQEADGVVVLDTGSTDSTVERLRNRGALVAVEVISPWRFDVARNRSMELIPQDADICVCTDLDEVFQPGWRQLLEKAWTPGTGQASFRYTWSFNQDGSEGVVFWYEKVHARYGYRWIHPVHEVLSWVGEGSPGQKCMVEGMQLNHYPDPAKSRAQYLPLLELSVLEDPKDDRNVHYLGREYMYRGRWRDCITVLRYHLTMPKATWSDERCASMRYIAKAYLGLGDPESAQRWYLRAIAEAPHLREPWLDYGQLAYDQQQWYLLLWLMEEALKIDKRPITYISEAASWGSYPYELAALANFYIGKPKEALEYIDAAIRLSPEDPRLLHNRQVFVDVME